MRNADHSILYASCFAENSVEKIKEEMQAALIRNGKPVEVLPLEISGMMSALPFREVKVKFDRIVQTLREMGCELMEPLLMLWTCGFMFRFQ